MPSHPEQFISIRPPAVAGRFYPDSPSQLREQVTRFVDEAKPLENSPEISMKPRAIIGPHAGYVYSGPTAGCAYRQLEQHRQDWDRVILIGPSHYVGFTGIAVPTCDAFATPLGHVPVDRNMVARALTIDGVQAFDQAHDREHGLEVHLPFLQVMLDSFSILPLVTGDCDGQLVARLFELFCADQRTLLVVSSDLSHYHDYETARDMDSATARAIEALDPAAIASDQACGQRAVQGLLLTARKCGWKITTLDLRNSGDTAGSSDRVVGYGAWVASM